MKRIGVYVYYDKSGKIEDYALYFLKSLLDVADEVIVVINGKIDPSELKKLETNRIKIIQRENTGYDFWAYRKGFLSIGIENLKNYDELIFANSSTFGPLFPFFEAFKKMKTKNVDFWGFTKHPETNKNVIKFNPKTKIKEHLQSYFLVFRKRMFTSEKFREYFENLRKIKNKKEAIAHLEVSFTEHFKSLGFTCDSFVDDSILKYEVENYHQYLPEITAKEYFCPLVKKTVFGERFDLAAKESCGNQTAKLFKYIKESTNYDTNLIIKEITKNYSMNEIKKFLHLNFVLKDDYREHFIKSKCAFVFENQDNIFEFIEPYLKQVSGLTDFFCFGEIKKTDVRINFLDKQKSFFNQIKKLAGGYDYILMFFPDKKLFGSLNYILKKEYVEHLFNCTLKNRIYLANLINTFLKNEETGVLVPVPFVFKGFKIQKNIAKKRDVEEFLLKSNIEIKTNINFLNTIPSCFWIRKEALEKINDVIDFEDGTNLNKGMIFSILAQKYGFLTGSVSSPDVISAYADSLEYAELKRNKILSEASFKIGKFQRREIEGK